MKMKNPTKKPLMGLNNSSASHTDKLPTVKTVKELRWTMFKKRQAESDRLSSNKAALHQAMLRASYQLMLWNNVRVNSSVLPSPKGYGTLDNGK